MRPFNLEEYLKNPSRKVVTRDGRDVRILCTDAKNDFPVVALVNTGNKEVVIDCDCNGRFSPEGIANFDLYFAPIKREGWVNIYKRMTKCSYVEESIYSSKEIAIKNKFGDSYVTTTKIEWEE